LASAVALKSAAAHHHIAKINPVVAGSSFGGAGKKHQGNSREKQYKEGLLNNNSVHIFLNYTTKHQKKKGCAVIL